jgi:hypothetical protein
MVGGVLSQENPKPIKLASEPQPGGRKTLTDFAKEVSKMTPLTFNPSESQMN